MSDSLMCPSCDVSWESSGSNTDTCGQPVCSECGSVLADTHLTSDCKENGIFIEENRNYADVLSLPSRIMSRTGEQSHATRQLSSAAEVRRLAGALKLTPPMRKEALGLFSNIFSHSEFRFRRNTSKYIIAAVVIYIICRQNDWPITCRDIARYSSFEMHEFRKWKNKIKSVLQIDCIPVDQFQLVKCRCESLNFTKDQVEKACSITKLSKDLWIVGGHSPDNVADTCCFLAWQSENVLERCRCSQQSFFKKYGRATYVRSTDLESSIRGMLCELARQLPWLNPCDIRNTNVLMHVNDIIQYQNTLVSTTCFNTRNDI